MDYEGSDLGVSFVATIRMAAEMWRGTWITRAVTWASASWQQFGWLRRCGEEHGLRGQ